DVSSVKIVHLPLGKVGVVSTGEREYAQTSIFFRPSEIEQDKLSKFLIDEFIALLNTNCFSVVDFGKGYYDSKISIVGEELAGVHSKKTDYYVSYINNCLSKGISRSFMFYGQPGTGKS